MPQIPSHYDTLKVSRNASRETIRAAYKQLARHYHPDRNSNSAESHQSMLALNASFEVLNDSGRRAAHDQWLAHEERLLVSSLRMLAKSAAWMRSPWSTFAGLGIRIREVGRKIGSPRIALAGFLAVLVGALYFNREPSSRSDASSRSVTVQESAVPPPPKPVYQRSRTAPNGTPWPGRAAEIAGYPAGRDDGKSVVIVDNSHNPADVFVKLVSLDGHPATPVRHVFIPAYGMYKCTNVRKGSYEVRYQDLGSGSLSRSEPFEVVETRTDRMVNYSLMKITLPEIADGKPPVHPISPSEF
jgi:hypothetical protein